MRLSGLWWWVDRWRKSTAYMDMTLEEQGAYRNLLDEACLRGGPLPKDERILAKACGDALAWRKVRTAVLAKFYEADDGWRNETLNEVLSESKRRAEKQKEYRSAKGNRTGNAAGNETGNAIGNATSNAGGNASSNTARPPDPDLDLSQDPDPKTRDRAREGSGRVFTGQRLKVSKRQHELLCDELGAMAGQIELLARYEQWDADLAGSGELFDTLEYIKRRAGEAVTARRMVGPRLDATAVNDRGEDWFEECQRLHGGGCGGRRRHDTQMYLEVERAKKAAAVSA